LVLKKLPNLNSIYSGNLLCNSLEEITVGDCPQLTRIPITISHSLKKIVVDPEGLLNTVEHFGRPCLLPTRRRIAQLEAERSGEMP
jgi:disease resistance protein RPS2